MKVPLSDSSDIDPYCVYIDCLTLLDQIRLLEGPRAVDNTLLRHPKIKVFLKAFQRVWIKRIEDTLLEHIPEITNFK